MSSIDDYPLRCGEVYLFSKTDERCDPETSLWGLFDKRLENGTVMLEAMTSDLREFESWVALPADFRYVRLSTRDELRDFAYSLNV